MKTRILSALAMSAVATALWAHHSPSAEFDMTKKTVVTGTLTKVDWINPHINIFVEAKGGAGTESWRLESNPPSWFRRVGTARADFAKAIGQPVTIEANRAKDGTTFGYMSKITFQDGTSMELVSPDVANASK